MGPKKGGDTIPPELRNIHKVDSHEDSYSTCLIALIVTDFEVSGFNQASLNLNPKTESLRTLNSVQASLGKDGGCQSFTMTRLKSFLGGIGETA